MKEWPENSVHLSPFIEVKRGLEPYSKTRGGQEMNGQLSYSVAATWGLCVGEKWGATESLS